MTKKVWEYMEELNRRGQASGYKFVANETDAYEAIEIDAKAYAWLRDIYGERRAKTMLKMERVQHTRSERDRFNQIYSVRRYCTEHYEVTVRFKTEAEALAFEFAFN